MAAVPLLLASGQPEQRPRRERLGGGSWLACGSPGSHGVARQHPLQLQHLVMLLLRTLLRHMPWQQQTSTAISHLQRQQQGQQQQLMRQPFQAHRWALQQLRLHHAGAVLGTLCRCSGGPLLLTAAMTTTRWKVVLWQGAGAAPQASF